MLGWSCDSNEYLRSAHYLKLSVSKVYFNKQKGESIVKYLGSAVDVVGIFLLTRRQCDVGDVLHWVGQGQQHLALLNRQNGGKRQMFNPDHLSKLVEFTYKVRQCSSCLDH